MVPFTDAGLDGYFENRPLLCNVVGCGKNHTAWDVVLGEISKPFMWGLFGPLGATTSLYVSKLYRDRAVHLNLYEHGLPRSAVVLDVNLTGYDLFCHETVGNNRRQRRRDGRLSFSGHTGPNAPTAPEESKVSIAVTWVSSSDSDFAWNNLISAFDAYADGDWTDAVIPANVAVENRLQRLMAAELSPTTSGDRLKDFLENGATYAHQLNVLLPYVAKVRGISPMTDHLRGTLNRLRALRNEIGHSGYSKHLTQVECASVLAAAIFGFRYLNWFSVKIGSPSHE